MSLPELHGNDELLRVAILTASSPQASQLKKQLHPHHIEVVYEGRIGEWDAQLPADQVDVLLVELGDDEQVPEHILDILLEQIEPPVLFNDSATARFASVRSGEQIWGRKLAERLRLLACAPRPKPRPKVVAAKLPPASSGTTQAAVHEAVKPAAAAVAPLLSRTAAAQPLRPQPAAAVTPAKTVGPVDVARRTRHQAASRSAAEIWVLGASIGGPQVVKEFLAAFTQSVPVVFVLAQHIGSGFIRLLSEQLNQAGALSVRIAEEGQDLQPGYVYVAPVEHDLGLTPEGRWRLRDRQIKSLYAPSIDHVMQAVSAHFTDTAHAMVFSGMGGDGLEGCRSINQSGGEVWVQEPKTCVVSAMVDNIRQDGLVTFTGTPAELAQRLIKRLQEQARTQA